MDKDNLSGASQHPGQSWGRTVQRHVLKEYEVMVLDVAISDGDGKMKQLPLKTTIFNRTSAQHGLKLKASRLLLNEVRPFGQMAFKICQLEAAKKSQSGIARVCQIRIAYTVCHPWVTRMMQHARQEFQ